MLSVHVVQHVLRMSTVPTVVRQAPGIEVIVVKCYLKMGSCLAGR